MNSIKATVFIACAQQRDSISPLFRALVDSVRGLLKKLVAKFKPRNLMRSSARPLSEVTVPAVQGDYSALERVPTNEPEVLGRFLEHKSWLPTLEFIASAQERSVSALAYSHDGQLLAIGKHRFYSTCPFVMSPASDVVDFLPKHHRTVPHSCLLS